MPAISASTFVISLGSVLAANTMTARLKEEGLLTDRQVFLSALMNTVPVYFREMFTYQLAFVIPVLGILVGGAYAIIFSATGIIKLIIIMILGRKFLDGDSIAFKGTITPPPKKSILQAAKGSLAGEISLFLRMAGIFFIMTFSILYLNEIGFLASLDAVPLAHFFQVPPETIIPLTVFVASPKAGMSLLGPMIQNGKPFKSKGPDCTDAGEHVHASVYCSKVTGAHLCFGVRHAYGFLIGGNLHGHKHNGEADRIVPAADDNLIDLIY
ncbi:MAG: hypothetical protein PHS80_03010 [Methanothrix sp.]|nr:hypothetical protein [Methanothrix sp.]